MRQAACAVLLAQVLLSPAWGGSAVDHLSRVWQHEFGSPAQIRDRLSPSQSADVPTPVQLPAGSPPNNQPHSAVVRIVVDEHGATSLGSGTLVDVREDFGLVVTNWHVVRDAQGPIQVHFPGGFTSQARVLKQDQDWDLAALVIWRPPVQPVPIAAAAPRPGDQLTICGYGPGIYRAATGRCTQYYAPQTGLPQQMVELDVEARQGDSGGPIFNTRGELAGVLFGAGQGTTMGSFGGRVDHFLTSLAPDIGALPTGEPKAQALAQAGCPHHETYRSVEPQAPEPQSSAIADVADREAGAEGQKVWQSCDIRETDLRSETPEPAEVPAADTAPAQGTAPPAITATTPETAPGATNSGSTRLFEQVKSALAAFGLISLAVLLLKAAG